MALVKSIFWWEFLTMVTNVHILSYPDYSKTQVMVRLTLSWKR